MKIYNLNALKETELKSHLDGFLKTISGKCGDNLISVILYGGVAKGDYIFGKSNTNILFVFEKVDLDVLDVLSLDFQRGMLDFRLSPFILTTNEIIPSCDVFAIKLFDINQHHFVLYGKNSLENLKFDNNHLCFISKQELSNKLARMKFFYIKNFNLPEMLLNEIQKGITTLLINANILLFLEGRQYQTTRSNIIDQLAERKGFNTDALKEMMALKSNPSGVSGEKIRSLYDELMVHCKNLIKDLQIL